MKYHGGMHVHMEIQIVLDSMLYSVGNREVLQVFEQEMDVSRLGFKKENLSSGMAGWISGQRRYRKIGCNYVVG